MNEALNEITKSLVMAKLCRPVAQFLSVYDCSINLMKSLGLTQEEAANEVDYMIKQIHEKMKEK